jgi:hypothetical protein
MPVQAADIHRSTGRKTPQVLQLLRSRACCAGWGLLPCWLCLEQPAETPQPAGCHAGGPCRPGQGVPDPSGLWDLHPVDDDRRAIADACSTVEKLTTCTGKVLQIPVVSQCAMTAVTTRKVLLALYYLLL